MLKKKKKINLPISIEMSKVNLNLQTLNAPHVKTISQFEYIFLF